MAESMEPAVAANAAAPEADGAIPVTVLTGFLGSGKTTLLQRMVRSPSFADAAVLINEYGDVGLDHQLVERVDEGIVLLQSGCICCTIRSDLRDSLRDLLTRRWSGGIPLFRRVVIETTGLADPTPIVSTILAEPMIMHHFRVGAVVCTVDAVNGPAQLDRQPESVKQVAIADRLVLTKVDLVDECACEHIERRLCRINPTAPVLRSRGADIDAGHLLTADLHNPAHRLAEASRWMRHVMPPDAAADAHHHDPARTGAVAAPSGTSRHDADIRSFALTFDAPLDWTAFGIWLSMLLAARGDAVLRVKGLLNVAGSPTPVVIHGVQRVVHPPVHLPRWPDADRRSRIVFIVRGIDPALIERSLTTFMALSG